jgi:hypothetical protein
VASSITISNVFKYVYISHGCDGYFDPDTQHSSTKLKTVLLLILIDHNHQRLRFIFFCSVRFQILLAQPFQSSSHGGWIEEALQTGAVSVLYRERKFYVCCQVMVIDERLLRC